MFYDPYQQDAPYLEEDNANIPILTEGCPLSEIGRRPCTTQTHNRSQERSVILGRPRLRNGFVS